MAGSVVAEKSKVFALRIVKLCAHLRDRKESVLSKQVLRSGTSIGANIAEGAFAQSKDDFASKYGRADCEELIRILAASVKTAKPRTHG